MFIANKKIALNLVIIIFSLLSCAAANSKPTPKVDISQMVSQKMKDFNSVQQVIFPSTNDKYVIIGKDNFNGSADSFVFSLIEGIDEDSHFGNLTMESYVADSSKFDAKFTVILTNDENPTVSFLSSQGGNLNSTSKIISNNISIGGNSLLEITLVKTAEIKMPDLSKSNFKKFNADILALSIPSDNKNISDTFKINQKLYGMVTGGAIYDVRINQLSTVDLAVDSDITGLVKVSGKLYKKEGNTIKNSIVKLYYKNPSSIGILTSHQEQIITDAQAKIRQKVEAEDIPKIVSAPAGFTDTQVKAVDEASEKIKDAIK